MRLASIAGISVAEIKYIKTLGKDVLLVERFDRLHHESAWYRRPVVSGLTVLNLDENWAREASYLALIAQIKKNGVNFQFDSIE
ncbi:HipA-like N-terminal domain-containing protein [Thorsellia anophelis DSM 18579]|uniref:HipA-like N-terminal domain-containing protein n=2 Tax=Thorsellia anophelis TaxID=336804 RepID=A0A1I0CIP3_9GAMM|nr:HipA-like N-terminal domain-containing protein [Thorsellia anophelis DSM 18579]